VLVASDDQAFERYAIMTHLSYKPPADGVHLLSSFAAALRDARMVTGRDVSTGEVGDPNRCGSWLGALGYMVLLDQIGKSFKPVGVPVSKERQAFIRALHYFSRIEDALEVDALYALRCAFAHDFSLSNAAKPRFTHHFLVGANHYDPLVVLPKQRWDGNRTTKRADTRTYVNLWALGNEVEASCKRLFDLANTDQLEIMLPGGATELVERYGLMIQEKRGG
jgi:hypothetical protein